MDRSNGSGFNSREEAERYHAERMRPRPTNLQYEYGPRDLTGNVREALPASPLDGNQVFQHAQATEQAQQAAMDKFIQEAEPQQGPMIANPNMDVASMAKAARQGAGVPLKEVPQDLIPQPFGEQTKKSLKEIAMEQGQIPRRRTHD